MSPPEQKWPLLTNTWWERKLFSSLETEPSGGLKRESWDGVFHPGQLSTLNPSCGPILSNHVYLNWLAHDKIQYSKRFRQGYWSAAHLYSWFYLWIWCSDHRVFMNRLWTFAEWNRLNFMVRLVSPGWQYSLPLNVWSLRKPLYKNILVTTSTIFASVTSAIALHDRSEIMVCPCSVTNHHWGSKVHASEYIFFREASRISRKVCAILCEGDNIFTHFSNASAYNMHI